MQWRARAVDILASRGFTRDGRGILAAADRRPTAPPTPGAPPSEASLTRRLKVRRLLPRVRPPEHTAAAVKLSRCICVEPGKGQTESPVKHLPLSAKADRVLLLLVELILAFLPEWINLILPESRSSTAEIIIRNIESKQTGDHEDALVYYNGSVNYGGDSCAVQATVLAFDISMKETVAATDESLNMLNHPYIMRSLGFGIGIKEHRHYVFLALPYFEITFAHYVDKNCNRAMNLKRFSEEFIQVTGCVVRGLVKLHTHSYYCPNLRGDHIAVVKENGLISACLWDFVFCETGNKGRNKDWRRLGLLLEKTARTHGAYTVEIKDMCDRMKNLTLTGMDVLKHSAMRSIRDKFDSVLALNTFVLLHCKSQDGTPTGPCTISSNSIPSQADFSTAECTILLKDRLDTNVDWISQLPTWIRKRILELGFNLPKKDTFRGFIWNLRCLIEHENKYIPPEANVKVSAWEMQFSDIEPDLEFEIRDALAELFLEALNYSMQIGLEF